MKSVGEIVEGLSEEERGVLLWWVKAHDEGRGVAISQGPTDRIFAKLDQLNLIGSPFMLYPSSDPKSHGVTDLGREVAQELKPC